MAENNIYTNPPDDNLSKTVARGKRRQRGRWRHSFRIRQDLEIERENNGKSRKYGTDDEREETAEKDESQFGSIQVKETPPTGVRRQRRGILVIFLLLIVVFVGVYGVVGLAYNREGPRDDRRKGRVSTNRSFNSQSINRVGSAAAVATYARRGCWSFCPSS